MRFRLANLICLACLLSVTGIAQQPAVPRKNTADTLKNILLHLQQNLSNYQANVPNFFCDEHAISDITLPNRRRTFRTTTDSVFSLQRASASTNTLRESREVKRVNGASASGAAIQGPAIFTGAFSGALSVVSPEMARCYNYTLESPGQLGMTPAISISYATRPNARKDQFCPGPEKESGRAWIDPVSFHLLRIEMRTPNHAMDASTLAMWTWAVDYAPVTFDNKEFWVPQTIATKARGNDIPVVWSFAATYSNYHKLTVSSHIITDVGDSPSAPPPQ